jgi:hypothetical protein
MTLLDEFNGLDAADIVQFINEERQEDLHHEFKTVNNASMNTDDRKNLAKCISGFANSDGGLVIWGVEARKNAQGIDCATAPAEISPLKLFLTKLNEYTGQASSPIVDGVQHRPIEKSADRGYAVTLVPQSISVPHMAKLGEDRYYKRAGDSFYRTEHFDLEDMFGRRQKPDLNLIACPMESLGDERERVAFNFHNTGRGLAKHLGFLARFENALVANVSGPKMKDVTSLNGGRPMVSYADNHSVVHPTGLGMNVGWAAFRLSDMDKPIIVHVTWYCENMISREATFELPPPAQ